MGLATPLASRNLSILRPSGQAAHAVVNKKGRPADVVHVLATPEKVTALETLLFAETGTFAAQS
jgi:uncharacterized protein (DUF111 family)